MTTTGAGAAHPTHPMRLPTQSTDPIPPLCPPDWYTPEPVAPQPTGCSAPVPELPELIDWNTPAPDLPEPPEFPIDFNGPPAAPQTAAGPSDTSDAVARRMLAVADVDGDGAITRQDTRGGVGADVTRDQLQLARRLLAIADRGAAGARDGVVTLAEVRGLTDEHAAADRAFSNAEFERLLGHVHATGHSAMGIRFPMSPANKR